MPPTTLPAIVISLDTVADSILSTANVDAIF
jgi:hypothetical protein